MLHQTGVFRGQTIYWCHWNLRQTDSGCHGNENLGTLAEKMAKTRLIQEIEHKCCTKQGIFEVKQFAGVIGIYIMATKM